MIIRTINPFTEDKIEEYSSMISKEVREKVANARKALEGWRETDIKERSKLVRRLGRRIVSQKEKLASDISEEMGKPIRESRAEVEKSALMCSYFARHAKTFLKDDVIETEYAKSYVRFEPLGVIGSIMPWNYPLWQALRFGVPAIIAGNTQIVKPSSVTVKSGGININNLFKSADFPDNVFQSLIGASATGRALVEANIDALSFTGSMEVGAEVGKLAVKDMKNMVLELGSSDPFIVLGDADTDKAANDAIPARFINCGQSCIAAKRFIIAKRKQKEFTEKLIKGIKELKIGDPMEKDTQLGPLVRNEQRDKLDKQIKISVQAGAKVLLGGSRPKMKGYFYSPTVLTNVRNDMVVVTEESFGPVASILSVRDDKEAIRTANESEFGLGASVWTKNRKRGEDVAKQLRTGSVFVNKQCRSDPRLPFGGVKKSGIGKELGRYGIMEMVNAKTIVVNG